MDLKLHDRINFVNHNTGKKGSRYPGWVKFNSSVFKDFYLTDTDFLVVSMEPVIPKKIDLSLQRVYDRLFCFPQFSKDTGKRSQEKLLELEREKSHPHELQLQMKKDYSVIKSYTDSYYDELEKQGKL